MQQSVHMEIPTDKTCDNPHDIDGPIWLFWNIYLKYTWLPYIIAWESNVFANIALEVTLAKEMMLRDVQTMTFTAVGIQVQNHHVNIAQMKN